MVKISEFTLHGALTVALALLIVSYGLALVAGRFERANPGLLLRLPLAVGLATRLAVVIAVDGTGLSTRLRGGDELTFMQNSHSLAGFAWSNPQWLKSTLHELYTALFAFQIKVGAFTPTAMRMTQIGVSLLGLIFIVAAVHDMAGPRAARLAAWVLMLEPAGIFFDSSLHKEPLMELASGLTVYGATKLWRHLDFRGIVVAGAGCALGIATRSYAGWFLVSACVLLALHGGIRRLDRPMRAMPLVYAVIIAGFLLAPTLLQVSTPAKLKPLQSSQDYNAAQGYAPPSTETTSTPTSNGNNLALERVDFSTRGKIVTNLPKRIKDVVLKPYPWQVQNASQALGAVGSSVALAGLLMLLGYGWRVRGRVFPLAAPLAYPTIFLLIAYSLSAGNAGTSFRYRTHVVTLALAMLIVLRTHARADRARQTRAPRRIQAPRASSAGVAQPIT